MKTNKILLGLTAVLFAAGAAFASVTTATQNAWYRQVETNPNSACLPVITDEACIPSDTPDCRDDTPHGNRQLFANNSCSQPLLKNSGF